MRGRATFSELTASTMSTRLMHSTPSTTQRRRYTSSEMPAAAASGIVDVIGQPFR